MIAIVTAAFRNADTLPALAEGLAQALEGRAWRLRIVVDASPDDTLSVARDLAAAGGGHVSVTALRVNVGQNRALLHGLAEEPEADAWVCLDADLQDPPAAVPQLVDRLAANAVGAVFAGRRGRYEAAGRLITGRAYRGVMSRLAGVPRDAGAFVAMGRAARDALVQTEPPSIVAGIGASGVRAISVPVERRPRPSGGSAWTAPARVGQAARTLGWLARQRLASHR